MNMDMLPPERDMPEGRERVRREHLVSEISRSSASRRKWWRALAIAPVGLVVAGGVAVATGVFDTDRISDPSDVICLAQANLDGRSALAQTHSPGGRVIGPLAACRPYWSRGVFSAARTVPPLQACLDTRRIVVVPGPAGTCERLRTESVAIADVNRSAERREEFTRQLMALDLTSCRTGDAVVDDVRGLLRRQRMDGWRVTSAGSVQESCSWRLEGSFRRREIHISPATDDRAGDNGSDDVFVVEQEDPTETEAGTQADFDAFIAKQQQRACGKDGTPEYPDPVERAMSCYELTHDPGGNRCVPPARVIRYARRILRENDRRDWTVKLDGPRNGCWSGRGQDSDLRTLTVVALPKRP